MTSEDIQHEAVGQDTGCSHDKWDWELEQLLLLSRRQNDFGSNTAIQLTGDSTQKKAFNKYTKNILSYTLVT